MVSLPDAELRTGCGDDTLEVEVIYAQPQSHASICLKLPAGSTLLQAIEASGLLRQYPEIDLAKNKLGIYGKLGKPDTLLRDRDRVEIYRPLQADPKEIRKRRAAGGNSMKKNRGNWNNQ